MSKLSPLDETAPRARPPAARGNVLRRNRRVPLHPEEIETRLRERAAESAPKGWRWPYGWLLILFAPDGSKHYRDIAPGKSYQDAVAVRDEEMSSDRYEKAWLIQKTGEER